LIDKGFTSHLTKNRSFWRRSSQPTSLLGTEKLHVSRIFKHTLPMRLLCQKEFEASFLAVHWQRHSTM